MARNCAKSSLPHLALDMLDEVIEQVCDGLKQLESDPERLHSLTSFPACQACR